jgi:ABC-type multidrug transport system ATPase subunit
MELVAEPSVLFLDEPTSGLDSSTAYDVCAKLREIARQQGLTIAAVIHSPSPATFREFDDFLLLGKGGQVVYMGPRELAVQYFAGIGFPCPAGESESDFFMDVVSDRIKSSLDHNFKLTDLFRCMFCIFMRRLEAHRFWTTYYSSYHRK